MCCANTWHNTSLVSGQQVRALPNKIWQLFMKCGWKNPEAPSFLICSVGRTVGSIAVSLCVYKLLAWPRGPVTILVSMAMSCRNMYSKCLTMLWKQCAVSLKIHTPVSRINTIQQIWNSKVIFDLGNNSWQNDFTTLIWTFYHITQCSNCPVAMQFKYLFLCTLKRFFFLHQNTWSSQLEIIVDKTVSTHNVFRSFSRRLYRITK